MKRYIISAILVLIAIMTVEVWFPLAAICIAAALILTGVNHGKSAHDPS